MASSSLIESIDHLGAVIAHQEVIFRRDAPSCRPHFGCEEIERFSTSGPFAWSDVAHERLGFHDPNVWFFGDGEQVIDGVSADQAIGTEVKWNPDLMDQATCDPQRLYAVCHQHSSLNNAPRRRDRCERSVLQSNLGCELR